MVPRYTVSTSEKLNGYQTEKINGPALGSCAAPKGPGSTPSSAGGGAHPHSDALLEV